MKLRWFAAVAALPLVTACAHAAKQTAAAPPPAPVATPVAAATPAAPPAAPAPAACGGDDQCSARELCLSSRCVAITPALPECHASAHFDLDRSVLHPADLPALRRVARCLAALPQEHALVAGNCDARGTAEYNIALGFRRAHATARYLEELGVPAAALSEVSYGKELPLCDASTDACWATNRRTDVTPGAAPRDVAALTRADERRERLARADAVPAGARPGAAARERPAAADATPPAK